MTDREIQHHLQSALDRETGIDAVAIVVTVDGGVVTLQGQVRTFAEMEAAERVALRIPDVCAVANEIDVKLEWNSSVPDAKAMGAVCDLTGVRCQVDDTSTVIP